MYNGERREYTQQKKICADEAEVTSDVAGNKSLSGPVDGTCHAKSVDGPVGRGTVAKV